MEQVLLLIYNCKIESSVLLDVKLWTNKMVGEISQSIQLDHENETIQHQNEKVF